MELHNLKLRNFRNYEELNLDFDPGVNLIVGRNAQGKTNLLEAVAYLGTGKSFRAQKQSEMLRFGAVNITIMLLSMGVLYLFNSMGIYYLLSKLLTVGFTMVAGFLLNRLIVFKG